MSPPDRVAVFAGVRLAVDHNHRPSPSVHTAAFACRTCAARTAVASMLHRTGETTRRVAPTRRSAGARARACMHANGRRGRASCLISSQTQTPRSNTGGSSIRRRAACLSPTCSCEKNLGRSGARPPRRGWRATVRVCVIADVFACFQDAATRIF